MDHTLKPEDIDNELESRLMSIFKIRAPIKTINRLDSACKSYFGDCRWLMAETTLDFWERVAFRMERMEEQLSVLTTIVNAHLEMDKRLKALEEQKSPPATQERVLKTNNGVVIKNG